MSNNFNMYARTKLYNKPITLDDPDVYVIGELRIHLTIGGNFITLEYNLYDKDDNLIGNDSHSEMIPKSIAKKIMEMTNYGASKT